MKVKEESKKAGLKLNIQKTKIMASGPHHFMANRWGNNGNSDRLSFLGSKITADGDSSHEIKKTLAPWKKSMTNLLLLLLLLSHFSRFRLCDPIDGSPPGSAIPGIFQARVLEWVAISFSRGSS